jgi:hypothetical protein
MNQQRISTINDAAEQVFEYLYLRDAPAERAGLIIGFGHFDMKIPRRCGELWRRYKVPGLLTGGRGGGTADLARPEADAFRDELKAFCPEIPDSDILVENRSTNTTENILFSIDLLKDRFGLSFLGEKTPIVIVASPYRQRRVFLTCLRNLASGSFINVPPVSSFGEETALFASKGLDLPSLLTAEVERLVNYPERGYIIRQEVPRKIIDLCATLRTQQS